MRYRIHAKHLDLYMISAWLIVTILYQLWLRALEVKTALDWLSVCICIIHTWLEYVLYMDKHIGPFLSLSFSLLHVSEQLGVWAWEGIWHLWVHPPRMWDFPGCWPPLWGQGLLLFLAVALVSGTQHGPSERWPGLNCMQVSARTSR